MERAALFEQERQAPKLPVRARAPATIRPSSLSPAAVLALQRSAGNASVARLLSDALPSGLVDSLTGVQKTVTSAESSALGAADAKAAAAEGALGEAPGALDQSLAAVEVPHTQAASAQRRQCDAQTANVQEDAKQLEADGNRAAAQVDAVAPTVPSLLSPARAIVDPGAVAADAGRLDALGDSSALDAGASVQSVLGAAAQPEWNVDLAEVVATAAGMRAPQVGGAVALGERRSGEERLAQITAFADQLGGRVSQLAGGLGSGLAGLGGQVAQRMQEQAGALTGQADSASNAVSEGYAAIKSRLTGDVEATKQRQLAGVERQAGQARDGIGGILGQAKNQLGGAAQTADQLLGGLAGSLLSLLPGSLRGLTTSVGDAQNRVDARKESLFPKLSQLAKRAADAIVGAAKSFADSKLQQMVLEERLIKQALDGARKLASAVGKAVSALVPDKLKALGAKLEAAAAGELAKLGAAADGVVGKLRNGACVVLEKVGGPYVRQYLPDIGNQIDNTVSITATTDLIVPLEEFGIPANLKVAAGASVEVGVLNSIYTVKVNGEARVLANELIGQQTHGGVTSTGPALSSKQQAFDKLAGAPAVAAKIGGAVADAGTSAGAAAQPGGTRAEIEAGLKGSVNAVWRFNAAGAQTSCDGIGGMLTLLGGLGASAALPSPFNQMAGGEVFKSFIPNLQSCRFSVGGVAGADVDVKTGGLADFKLGLGAEVAENIELTGDGHGGLVAKRTRTIQADLDATALAGLTSGSFAKYRAFIGGEGIARLTMSYDKDTDDVLPSALGGAIALSLGASNFSPELIPEEIRSQAPEIEQLLTGSFPGIDGPREVKITLTIGRVYEQLEPLGRELKAYLAGPIETITVDGVMEIVQRNFATLTPTDYGKLTISQTQRKEVDLGAAAGEGAAAGADVDVKLEHTLSRTFRFPAENEVVELASGRARLAAQVVEPDKKKKPDKRKGKPQAPIGTEDDPIEMLWAKPLKRYTRPMSLMGPKGVLETYKRDEPKLLKPGMTIGVSPFFGAKGTVFKRRNPTPRDPKVEDTFTEALDDAGFVSEGEPGSFKFSGDHVFDLGYGGADAFSNLWPLERDTNRKAGVFHGVGQIVEFNLPSDPPEQKPRHASLASNAIDDTGTLVGPFWIGLHFKIKDVVDPP